MFSPDKILGEPLECKADLGDTLVRIPRSFEFPTVVDRSDLLVVNGNTIEDDQWRFEQHIVRHDADAGIEDRTDPLDVDEIEEPLHLLVGHLFGGMAIG